MSEAKDWAGELISAQTGMGKILVQGLSKEALFFIPLHLSLLGFYPETWQDCNLSINLLITLAGLSTNISADKPANLSRCMVKS